MEYFEYAADILPTITLFGFNSSPGQQKNGRRITDDYIFYMITDGEMHFQENEKNYILKKGDCFLFEPNILHFGTAERFCNYIYVHFKHPYLSKKNLPDEEVATFASNRRKEWFKSGANGPYPDNKIIIPKQVSFEDFLSVSDMVSKMEKAIEKRKIHYENYDTTCACAVTEFFVEMYQKFVYTKTQSPQNPEANTRINEVIRYINLNYKQKITSEIIEKELCYNFDYLNQVFNKHLNTSVFKYLTSVRMQAAKELLKSSSFTVKEISRRVGYDDDTYFFKVFKKQTGFSPNEYRKNAD